MSTVLDVKSKHYMSRRNTSITCSTVYKFSVYSVYYTRFGTNEICNMVGS